MAEVLNRKNKQGQHSSRVTRMRKIRARGLNVCEYWAREGLALGEGVLRYS